MMRALREALLSHIAEAVTVLLLIPFGTLVWATMPTLLEPLWSRLSIPTLQRILGLALLSTVVLLAYVILLYRRLRTKVRIKFGLKWHRDLELYCSSCDKPLSEYREGRANLDPHFWCVSCKAEIHITDDKGRRLTLTEAKERLRSRRLPANVQKLIVY